MNKDDLKLRFGDSNKRVENAIKSLKSGKGIILVDNEDRENEGDLVFAAETMNVKDMALMIRECSGIVCLCLTSQKVNELGLKPMVENNTSRFGTNFTESIEAAEGVTTGVSASDRITTIQAAIAQNATGSNLHKPGHIFPLLSKENGVLDREGHTEGSVDLMKLAKIEPYAVLCELTNEDGTMSNLSELMVFAAKNKMPLVTIEDIKKYRILHNC